MWAIAKRRSYAAAALDSAQRASTFKRGLKEERSRAKSELDKNEFERLYSSAAMDERCVPGVRIEAKGIMLRSTIPAFLPTPALTLALAQLFERCPLRAACRCALRHCAEVNGSLRAWLAVLCTELQQLCLPGAGSMCLLRV